MIIASNERTCGEFWRKKQYHLGLPTFILSASTKIILRLIRQILFLTISVYDY